MTAFNFVENIMEKTRFVLLDFVNAGRELIRLDRANKESTFLLPGEVSMDILELYFCVGDWLLEIYYCYPGLDLSGYPVFKEEFEKEIISNITFSPELHKPLTTANALALLNTARAHLWEYKKVAIDNEYQ